VSPFLFAAIALANPEVAYDDVRSLGMGGNQVAAISDATAVAVNPAALLAIERFSATLGAPAAVFRATAPVAGPNDNTQTPATAAPIPHVHVGWHPHERIAIGAGAYLLAGFGTEFQGVDRILGYDLLEPEDYGLRFVHTEFGLATALRPHDAVDVGLAVALPHAGMSGTQPIFPFDAPPISTDISLEGWGGPRFRIGLNLHPHRDLVIGLVYRTVSRIPLKGEIDVPILGDLADPTRIRGTWSSPVMFAAGLAGYLDDRRTLITGTYRVQLHSAVNESMAMTLKNPEGLIALIAADGVEMPLGWTDAHMVRLGTERWFTEAFAGRIGGQLMKSATSPESAQFFSPPPGVATTLSTGAGVRHGLVRVDGVTGLSWGHSDIEDSGGCTGETPVGCPGTYAANAVHFGASVTFGR